MVGPCALVLAAGRSSRMGAANKLTTLWKGKPLLRHVVDAALNTPFDRILAVTGHDAESVVAVLGSGIETIHNADFAKGMASSIRCGISASEDADGVMILLGDMPLVTAEHMRQLLTVFAPVGAGSIVVATCEGAPANPVVFSRHHFPALMKIEGDRGAKKVIEANSGDVIMVEIGDAARRDFDTPGAFVDP